MKNRIPLFFLALCLIANAAGGTTTLDLQPLSGSVSGAPGSTVGWGFTLTNDSNYLRVSFSAFAPATPIGTYHDFTASQNIVAGPAPESTTVSESFSASFMTGIGSFVIAPGAISGSTVTGFISIMYDLYSRSPNDPAFDPAKDFIGSGIFNKPVTITVTGPAAAPEGGATLLLLGSSSIALLLAKKRRQP